MPLEPSLSDGSPPSPQRKPSRPNTVSQRKTVLLPSLPPLESVSPEPPAEQSPPLKSAFTRQRVRVQPFDEEHGVSHSTPVLTAGLGESPPSPLKDPTSPDHDFSPCPSSSSSLSSSCHNDSQAADAGGGGEEGTEHHPGCIHRVDSRTLDHHHAVASETHGELLEDLEETITTSFYGYVTILLTDYKSSRWLRCTYLFLAYLVVFMQMYTILAMMLTSMFPRCQPRDQDSCPMGTVCTGVWSVYYGQLAYPMVAWDGVVDLYDHWGEDYQSGPAVFSNYRFFCEDCKATTQVDYWTNAYPSMAGQNLYDSFNVTTPQDEADKCNCSLWGKTDVEDVARKKKKGSKNKDSGGALGCDKDGNIPAGCAYARNLKLMTSTVSKTVFLLIAAATGCACVVEKRQCTIHEFITSQECWRLRDGLKRGCFDFDFWTLYLLYYVHYILRPVVLYLTTASVCTIIAFNELVDANSVVLDGLSIVFILEIDDVVFSAMSFSRMHKNMFNVQIPFLTSRLDLRELVDRVYYRTFFCFTSTFTAIIVTLFWFVSEAADCSRMARHMLFWPCLCTLLNMLLELILPLVRKKAVSFDDYVPSLNAKKSGKAKLEIIFMWSLKFFFVFIVFDVGMREEAWYPRFWHIMWKSKYGVPVPQSYTPTSGAALGLQDLWGFA